MSSIGLVCASSMLIRVAWAHFFRNKKLLMAKRFFVGEAHLFLAGCHATTYGVRSVSWNFKVGCDAFNLDMVRKMFAVSRPIDPNWVQVFLLELVG